MDAAGTTDGVYVPKYTPPLPTVVLGALAIAFLAVMAYGVRTTAELRYAVNHNLGLEDV